MTTFVDQADVRSLIEVSSTLDIKVHCDAAVITCDSFLLNKGLSPELIRSICTFLAAHFVCLTVERGGLRRSRLGESDESFKAPGDANDGFASTRYGQQALLLDTTGTLAAISANKGLKAQFSVVMNKHYVKPVELWKYQ